MNRTRDRSPTLKPADTARKTRCSRTPTTRSRSSSSSSTAKRHRATERGNTYKVLKKKQIVSRRSSLRRPEAARGELAAAIVGGKRVVFITGAGLSVASGIRPFRSNPSYTGENAENKQQHVLHDGLWNDVIWTTATKRSFRKDPALWYETFWNAHFEGQGIESLRYQPNRGHEALQSILEHYKRCKQITQNIDGLQPATGNLIEVHGRAGLFKCCPVEDSDSDDDEDSEEDDGRPVSLGNRERSAQMKRDARNPETCPYQHLESLQASELGPNRTCPVCQNPVMPQALLFDEGYHSHAFYQFQKAEDWLAKADCLVFVGTSFAVTLTSTALEHARKAKLPVFNFNLAHGSLTCTARLNVSNIPGPAVETLPALWQACQEVERQL